MKFFFFIMLSLVLIIAQTSIFPGFSFFSQSFDLLIVNVIYLSLISSNPCMILVVILLGTIMDSLSGAPFGIYISVYVWIFISVQGMKIFVHPGSIVLLPIVSSMAVLIENLFLLFSFFVRNGKNAVSAQDFVFMVKQIMWAFVFIPLLIVIIHAVQKSLLGFVGKITDRLMGQA